MLPYYLYQYSGCCKATPRSIFSKPWVYEISFHRVQNNVEDHLDCGFQVNVQSDCARNQLISRIVGRKFAQLTSFQSLLSHPVSQNRSNVYHSTLLASSFCSSLKASRNPSHSDKYIKCISKTANQKKSKAIHPNPAKQPHHSPNAPACAPSPPPRPQSRQHASQPS